MNYNQYHIVHLKSEACVSYSFSLKSKRLRITRAFKGGRVEDVKSLKTVIGSEPQPCGTWPLTSAYAKQTSSLSHLVIVHVVEQKQELRYSIRIPKLEAATTCIMAIYCIHHDRKNIHFSLLNINFWRV